MDDRQLGEALGETGLIGLFVLATGFILLARENRRIALGAVAITVGHWLVSHGVVGSFLESLGMGYDDLY